MEISLQESSSQTNVEIVKVVRNKQVEGCIDSPNVKIMNGIYSRRYCEQQIC